MVFWTKQLLLQTVGARSVMGLRVLRYVVSCRVKSIKEFRILSLLRALVRMDWDYGGLMINPTTNSKIRGAFKILVRRNSVQEQINM